LIATRPRRQRTQVEAVVVAAAEVQAEAEQLRRAVAQRVQQAHRPERSQRESLLQVAARRAEADVEAGGVAATTPRLTNRSRVSLTIQPMASRPANRISVG
jgi:hypothetical protein